MNPEASGAVAFEQEAFSGGIRLWWPCACHSSTLDELAELDWSLARLALDPLGRLIRLVDVPAWQRAGAKDLGRMASAEVPPVMAHDASAAYDAELETVGIEVDGGTYWPGGQNHAARWEFSPTLGRFCGSIMLARAFPRRLPAFTEYILRLNRDVRFARIGYQQGGIAMQVVFCRGDRRWLAFAQDVLMTLQELLRPEAAWWDQPRALVAALLHQASRSDRLNPRKEK